MKNHKINQQIKNLNRQLLFKQEQEFFGNNLYSDNSIEQFLNFNQNRLGLTNQQNKSEIKLVCQDQQILESQHEIQQIRIKRQKSIYHNFQKHLVIAIRKIVPLKYINKRGDIGQAARVIWDLFFKGKFCSKQFLYFIFGLTRNTDKKTLEKFKMKKVLQKYGHYTFKAAQKYVKETVINIFSQIDDQKIIYGRRIQKKHQFVKYTRKFILQLQGQICVGKQQVRFQNYQQKNQQCQTKQLFGKSYFQQSCIE